MAFLDKSFGSLCFLVIKAIYGNSGHLGVNNFSNRSLNWVGILKAVNQLSYIDVHLLHFCTKMVGDGASISFWDDAWLGGLMLKY